MIEIGKDGTETLRAVYSEIMGKFTPVESRKGIYAGRKICNIYWEKVFIRKK